MAPALPRAARIRRARRLVRIVLFMFLSQTRELAHAYANADCRSWSLVRAYLAIRAQDHRQKAPGDLRYCIGGEAPERLDKFPKPPRYGLPGDLHGFRDFADLADVKDRAAIICYPGALQ
jgi:hypothetical protein